MQKKPVMLIVMDGFGIGEEEPGNATLLAKTPVLDRLLQEWPSNELQASGEAVGLPEGQMGNSEVGHLNIGAGRVMYQNLSRISNEISNGDFLKKESFLQGIQWAKENHSKVHLMGLLSDGGVHSHRNHLYALLELMKRQEMEQVFVHGIMDGRDVSPTAGQDEIEALLEKMDDLKIGKLGTVVGRYFAMDRDQRWERTQKAYNAFLLGEGTPSEDILNTVKKEYRNGVTDEFLPPIVMEEGGKPVGTIGENDVIIFFNFRPDRARQIVRAFVDSNFQGFQRKKEFHGFLVTMTQYDKTISNTHVAYDEDIPKETLGEYLSEQGKKQLRIAETEKYAHVTFFLNGGVEVPFEGEDRILIPSPKVATYDLQPEMSALGVTEAVIQKIKEDKYDFIMLNFANTDMVGHTGDIPATIKAIETVDTCLGKILEALLNQGGAALVTADHGNCERMLTKDNKPVTSHTINPVPIFAVGMENIRLKNGRLADLAPTMLYMMGLESPKEMTGKNLIEEV